MLFRKNNKAASNQQQSTGEIAEQTAFDYLLKKGLKPVTRNYRCRFGEIDLIMQDGGTLVFVEVRFRRSSNFGSAAATVSSSKQQRLLKTAALYLQNQSHVPDCRFDVVGISQTMHDNKTNFCVNWIQNAFC
jgi:putative endonuclease